MSVNLLAIETSADCGSVALSCHDTILYREAKMPKQHSIWILPMIDNLLAEAGLQRTQLDVISFGRGPGSFTGIRLATSIAQGISFSLGIPVIPVSTLQALAQQAWREHQCAQVLTALDARLNQIYWSCYQYDEKTRLMQRWGEERVEDPQQAKWPKELPSVWRGIGSGWDHYQKYLTGEWIADSYPKAYDIATIANYEYQQGRFISALEAKPSYIRNQVASMVSESLHS